MQRDARVSPNTPNAASCESGPIQAAAGAAASRHPNVIHVIRTIHWFGRSCTLFMHRSILFVHIFLLLLLSYRRFLYVLLWDQMRRLNGLNEVISANKYGCKWLEYRLLSFIQPFLQGLLCAVAGRLGGRHTRWQCDFDSVHISPASYLW